MHRMTSNMSKAGGAILFALAFGLFQIPLASAETQDMNVALGRYPISGTRLNSCALCHVSATNYGMNNYGRNYKSNGRNASALTAIESLDSDSDGFSNIVEINNLTFPGNASDHPPDPTSTPTHSATATDTPTLTPTETPTQTDSPTETATFTDTPTELATNTPTEVPTQVIDTDLNGDGVTDDVDLFIFMNNWARQPN